MPKSKDALEETTVTGAGIRVIDIESPDIAWQEYGEMPGDQTPGNPPGMHAIVYESPDKRVTVGVWKRDADIGELLGGGLSLDFVIEGQVEVTDENGVTHTARDGDLLIYSSADKGSWHQPGPIRKIYIHVRNEP
jgi:uncharacterized cupin superfamily protein